MIDNTNNKSEEAATAPAQTHFIKEIIRKDLAAGKHDGRVCTRFPPEPNGYLHLGHAKSICLNFGLAIEFGGRCNLRFDDTNPCKEEQEYVDSIIEDVRWLGFNWEDKPFYASDYFDQLYGFAVQLIKIGKAYVCDLSAEEIRKYRGTLTDAGREGPDRNRSVEENLELFERMRAGEFPDGTRTLRAKIDMASPNLNMRDPVIYRILHASITAQAINGAYTRCMILLTASQMQLSESPIPSVPWNSPITSLYTTGSSSSWESFHPGSTSLPGST